jgi:hypothetical protein
MVVSKYPAWVATVVYKDGHAHHFDGAKDLFKYLFDVPRYAAATGRRTSPASASPSITNSSASTPARPGS